MRARSDAAVEKILNFQRAFSWQTLTHAAPEATIDGFLKKNNGFYPMKRVLEPEIMDGLEQARAYAQADFSEENQAFVDHFVERYPECTEGLVLDLGCGPADIPIRIVQKQPSLKVLGIDASIPMIDLARVAIEKAGLSGRITLECQRIQEVTLPDGADAVISNSLVHHIPNALQFWYAVKTLAKPGSPVLVMDLLRPDSPEDAEAMVNQYASQESAQLRKDFYNSLLSAWTEDEVAAQLAELNLSRLLIDVLDDRHWVVYGRVF